MPTATSPPRSEISHAFQWNAESVFPDVEAWEAEFQAISIVFDPNEIKPPVALGSSKELHEQLEFAIEWLVRAETIYLYAAMEHSVETTIPAAAERYSQARGLLSRVQSHLSGLRPRVLAIGQETIISWVAQEPSLGIYQHYLDDMFLKEAHIGSLETETLLGLLGDPFAGTSASSRVLTNADFKFQPAMTGEGRPVELTQGSIQRLLSEPDRILRKNAWENYLDQYRSYQNTLANNLETSIKQNVFLSRAHKYDSTLEAALFEDQIPTEIFHNLIHSFKQNLPLWHRYWNIRRDTLGVDSLEPFDALAPLTDTRPTVTYQQAVEWICSGLAPMGDDYIAAIRRGCGEERWVDVYPNQGKRGGAFSSGVHGTHPFIVMSYNDTLFSMSTLAHELGHSMHSYLTWQSQPAVYGDYSLFVAEVASNFHQAMVRAYLMGQSDDPFFRIALIEEAMANFYRYLFVMPTLARLELESHQRVENGQGLTAQILNDLCTTYFKEAYGPDMHIDPDRVGIIWATFGHLYVDYYVYQYATGIAGAYALAQGILSDESGAVDNYLNFLKLGSSCYPFEALEVAGVDLSSPQVVQAAFDGMSQMLNELEVILDEIGL